MLATTSFCKFLLVCNVSRKLSTTVYLKAKFDKRLFMEPIVNLEKLNKPLEDSDPYNYLHQKPMKSDESPVFYRNRTLTKLIRVLERYGEKEKVAQKVYLALEKVKRRQYELYKNAKNDEERKKIILDPITLTELALKNCRPVMRLSEHTRGGAIYQVPTPINENTAEFMALRMMKFTCKEKAKHGAYRLEGILSDEIIAASKNEGFTIQAKQEHHRQCEANRAFSHYIK